MANKPQSVSITRRQFLKGAAIGTAGLALCGGTELFAAAPTHLRKSKPNLLFIHTDQQHFQAISGLGNRHLRTPNMDRLMSRGTTFTQAYSANPVCCPARACWYTGRPASENGMVVNDIRLLRDMPDMGKWFGDNGYHTAYSGKWHIGARDTHKSFNQVLTVEPSGLGEHSDATVSLSAESFLKTFNGDKPFFLSLGLMQPHDICYWCFTHPKAIDRLPSPLTEADLPELPPNFKFDPAEPETFARSSRGTGWDELTWRYYLYSYYRMVEMVDGELGRILDALDNSKHASNTVIIFTADHGDGAARHQLISKMYLYDEAARVPFIISYPGEIDRGKVDRNRLISGLDVAPTLCDYAGIPKMPKARGLSLKPMLERSSKAWRDFLVTETAITGRMLRTENYKLITYKGDATQQLFNMRSDPGETHNLARESNRAETVSDLNKLLADWESHLEPAPVDLKKWWES